MSNEIVPWRQILPDEIDKSGLLGKAGRSLLTTTGVAKIGIDVLSLLHRHANERLARTQDEVEAIKQGYRGDATEDKEVFERLKITYGRNVGRIVQKAGNDITRLIDELPPYIDTRSRGQRFLDEFLDELLG